MEESNIKGLALSRAGEDLSKEGFSKERYLNWDISDKKGKDCGVQWHEWSKKEGTENENTRE